MHNPQIPSRSRINAQPLILLTGFLIWALWPQAWLSAVVGAYLAAWLLVDRLSSRLRTLEMPFSRRGLAVLALALLAIPAARLIRDRGAFHSNEGFRGMARHLADRERLEDLPSIAPPVVFWDHPQTFYIRTSEAPDLADASLELHLGDGGPVLPGKNLGHGLFRVDYDPREAGLPAGESASVNAEIHLSNRVVSRRLTGIRPKAHPRWFASAPELGLASAASEETDEVFIVDREGLRHRLPVADGPSDTAFFARGERLAVAHRYSPELWIVDPASGQRLTVVPAPRFQHRLAVSPDEARLAVAVAGREPAVVFYQLPTGAPASHLSLDFSPDWLAFGTDGETLFVSSAATRSLYRFSRRDGDGWQPSGELPLGRPVVTLARAHDGDKLYLAVTDYRPDGVEHRGNHFIQDQILVLDTASFRIFDQHLTARRSSRQSQAGNVDRGASPMGIVVRDNDLLVAFAGTDEVWSLGPDLGLPRWMLGGLDLDLINPHGVADLGEGFWAASSPSGGALAVYDQDGYLLHFVGVTPTDGELYEAPEDSLERLALTLRSGERAFYEATRSGISCQSCHLHGGTDHSPHDIGQPPLLPTLTTRGVAGTAPYLRDASFPRIRDLNDHLASTLYRGYERFEEDRKLALETWVESLPREVNPHRFEPPDLDRRRRGLDAFIEARCELCHSLPAFTNLGQHPFGSLFPELSPQPKETGEYTEDGPRQPPAARLDTPTLIGLWNKSHLLQDGRAHDLEEVLTTYNAANRHGDSAALSTEERGDLIHFLQTL